MCIHETEQGRKRDRRLSARTVNGNANAIDHSKKVRRVEVENDAEKDEAIRCRQGAREPSSSGFSDRGKLDSNARSRQQSENQDPAYSSYSSASGCRSYGNSRREDSRRDKEKDWQVGTDRLNSDKGYKFPGNERNRLGDRDRDLERNFYGKNRDSRKWGRSRDPERDRERHRDKDKDQERGRESNHGGRDYFGPDNDVRGDKERDRSRDRDRDKNRLHRTEYNDTDELKDRDRHNVRYDYRGRDHYRDKDAQKYMERDRMRYKDDQRRKDHSKEEADYVDRDHSMEEDDVCDRDKFKGSDEEGAVHEYTSVSQHHHYHGKEKLLGARAGNISSRDDRDEKHDKVLKGFSTDNFKGVLKSCEGQDVDNRLDSKHDSASKVSIAHAKSSKNSKWGPGSQLTSESTSGNASGEDVPNDLATAKLAAMKAAELVNKNLGVAGFMSADQKKKLLWGAKKSITEQEPVIAAGTNRWDTVHFADRGRQEKFNKLMGVKAEVKGDCITEVNEEAGLFTEEKQRELQQDLENQFTAGLRRRDGRTVGLGL
ncbi:hypothetical protein O6H91_04G102000 [Diphasiastrum complanatum]|uniref:Uncharacterized protein n=1 Tax=Diphasiastrum complanatum TaxID=34168 RepID=A0ACC2DZL9_DIPCM|nr:hypothetical protein O6H91_04G102000 [Diphasiastrum complanatum]